MNILYAQSPALFWCALALIVCFFVRRGAHRVRAVLDLVLGLLCVVGGVALYYLGMYNDAFTIRDFWHIRTAGWIGLAVVVLVTVWQVVKATRRSVSAHRAARQAERDEKTRQKELEDAIAVRLIEGYAHPVSHMQATAVDGHIQLTAM